MPDWTLQTCTVPTGRTRVLYIVLHTCTARTCVSSIYQNTLYTELTHPVCSDVYKAHIHGHTHTRKHSTPTAGVALVLSVSKLCTQASLWLALHGHLFYTIHVYSGHYI